MNEVTTNANLPGSIKLAARYWFAFGILIVISLLIPLPLILWGISGDGYGSNIDIILQVGIRVLYAVALVIAAKLILKKSRHSLNIGITTGITGIFLSTVFTRFSTDSVWVGIGVFNLIANIIILWKFWINRSVLRYE